MDIIVQRDISDLSSRRLYAQIATETLTLKDLVLSLSEIIDDESNGYRILPFVNARGEGLHRLDIYTSLRKERADRAYILSNGRNTIYMLDYIVKARRVYHDPVLCIIGPDAEEIAEHALKRLSRILLSKTYRIELDQRAIWEFSKLMGYERAEVMRVLSEIFKEAEMALKIRLLRGGGGEEEHPSVGKRLSERLIREIERRPLSVEPIRIEDIIPFGAIIILIIILLVILMRL